MSLAQQSERTVEVTQPTTRPRWWVQVLLIVCFAEAYDEVRALHGNVVAVGISHGYEMLRIDRWLHIDWSHSMNMWLSHHDAIGDTLAGYYVIMHLGMTALTLLILWVHGARYRYHRNVLILSSLVGLGIYWFYPVAPPRLIGNGVHDIVASTLPFAYRVETSRANLYAAVPSLHMAWSVWVAIALWTITTKWWLRAIEVLHPVLTAVTVLATGNHYTFDLITGVALTLIGYGLYAVAQLLIRRLTVARGTPRGSPETAGT